MSSHGYLTCSPRNSLIGPPASDNNNTETQTGQKPLKSDVRDTRTKKLAILPNLKELT